MAYTSQETWLSAVLFLVFCVQGGAWDYSLNGANWGSQGKCGSSSQQSPVDLPNVAQVEEVEKVFLKYPKIETTFQLYHNGNSIALTLPESHRAGFGLGAALDGLGSKDGQAYRLWQVNFHSPSEHTLNGVQMPLEMQMMHQRVTGGGPETAVVVVLFQDAANSYLDFLDKLLLNGLPKKAWEEKSAPVGVDFGSVMGGSPYYHYTGSLTVPPCESQIKYYIRQEPIPTAHAQLRRFQKVLQETCAPKGNFRLVRPLTGLLTLMPSVDVIRGGGVVVNPRIGKVDEAAAPAAEPKPATQDSFVCPQQYLDAASKNVGRVQVGDSPEYIAAKERFIRNKREKQVAEGSEGNAHRAYKYQQQMYEQSPGWAEKINNKWALDGSKAVYDGAQANMAGYAAGVKAEEEAMVQATHAECWRLHEKKMDEEKKRKEEEAKNAPKEPLPPPPPPPPPPAKYVYPEPHVKLPRGVDASPFASKGADTAPAKADGSSDVNADKVAPNLQQPDLPPAASIVAAEGKKEVKAVKTEPPPEIMLRVDLPISPGAIPDKAEFRKELGDALAESAEVERARLDVQELKGQAVTKVHGTPSLTLAQQSSTKFLRIAQSH